MSSWSALFLLIIATQGATPTAQGDVTWYIAPGGSSDVSTCGRTQENPCDSLGTILRPSPFFSNDTLTCYVSDGAGDNRTSTTIYFLGGSNIIPPLCLNNWENLTIIGVGDVSIASNSTGGSTAFFEFTNCTNIAMENLFFETAFVGRRILYFQTSNGITITNCTFPLMTLAGSGVYIQDSSGRIVIEKSLFYGDPIGSRDTSPSVALLLRQGIRSSEQFVPVSTSFDPYDAVIRDCVFRDIVSSDRRTEDSYRRSRNDGIGLVVLFYAGAHNNWLSIENSTFTGIRYSPASGVLVSYDTGSIDNTVRFSNCDFRDNSVRYGGGIASYFTGSPQNGILEIEGCNFFNNSASFEGGGVFAAFLSRELSNRVFIASSNFTANYAQYGAGVFFFNNPAWFDVSGPSDAVAQPLIPSNITSCTFHNNTALMTEGTINTLRMVLYIDGVW